MGHAQESERCTLVGVTDADREAWGRLTEEVLREWMQERADRPADQVLYAHLRQIRFLIEPLTEEHSPPPWSLPLEVDGQRYLLMPLADVVVLMRYEADGAEDGALAVAYLGTLHGGAYSERWKDGPEVEATFKHPALPGELVFSIRGSRLTTTTEARKFFASRTARR